MRKWKLKCVQCGRTEMFTDTKDITTAYWRQIGWNVATNEPICFCDICDERNSIITKKKK